MRKQIAKAMQQASRIVTRQAVLRDRPGYPNHVRFLDHLAGWLYLGSVILDPPTGVPEAPAK